MDSIRLLIVDESLNHAEKLASGLRNAGIPVRLTRIENIDDFQTAIKDQDWDIIFTPVKLNRFHATQALEILLQSKKDIPYIIINDNNKEEDLVNLMEKGAADIVEKEATTRLQFATQREIRNLNKRRALKRSLHALSEAEKRCRILIDSSRDAITYIHEGMHVYANSTYLEMFGYNEFSEMEGMPIMDMIAPDDQQKFKEFLKNYKQKAGEQKIEMAGIRLDGSKFNALMEFTPASIDTEPCTQIVIRDQSQSKELETKLQYLSKQDLLTGLHNRQYFLEELELSVGNAASGSGGSTVLYVELDSLSKVKETAGIAGLDTVLNDFANILRTQSIEGMILARFSDTVFTVLIPNSDLETAHRFAENLRLALEQYIFEIAGQSLTLTCSIGISLVSEYAENGQTIFNYADVACNIAKSKGGNWIHIHDPVNDAEAGRERDSHWVRLLRQALEKSQFRMLFQPIVSLHGEAGENYEVLIRMLGAQGDLISPSQFIPAAESADLMPAIDRWVIENAIVFLAEHRKHGNPTQFFIKLSGNSLKDETLLPWISRRLTQARLQGDSLIFEISEKNAVSYLKQAKYFCKGLKQLHCKIALEHFGIGANSFNCLKHLDVDFLKIDGSLVHNLANDNQNQAMVKSINDMAHSMNKLTIAEYVQDATSLALLWQYGVNYIQGNYLQKPYENLTYDFSGESQAV